jgi:branched-chain amino acid transport system permease protein
VIITFLQIMLSDVTSAWQLYFGLMFIGIVMFAPEGVVGWTMLHLWALRGGAAWRLAPAYAAIGPALAASGAGAIMIIELTNRQLAEARSEGRRCVSSASTLTPRRCRPGSSQSCCSHWEPPWS